MSVFKNEPTVLLIKKFANAYFYNLKSNTRLCTSLPHGSLFMKIILNIHVDITNGCTYK